MKQIKVEGQWNGREDMMLNISHFPHLHASFTADFENYNRYPHPLEYFLASLIGSITLTIKSFIEKRNLSFVNLYITIVGDINPDRMNKFHKLSIHIRLDSNASPEELTSLQKSLLQEDTIFNLLKDEEIITVNWD